MGIAPLAQRIGPGSAGSPGFGARAWRNSRAVIAFLAAQICAGPRAFGTALLNERERWALWLPVALGSGIGIYFALPIEPASSLVLVFVFFAAALITTAIAIDRAALRVCCIGLATLLLGFGLAKWRCETVAAPIVMHRLGPIEVTGRVEFTQLHGKGIRVVLAPISIIGVATKDLPRRVRVSIRKGGELLAPGSIAARCGTDAAAAARVTG